MSEHHYYARAGRVYDETGAEAGTARTAGGRDLERHAAALEQARAQREELERAGSIACPDCGAPWPATKPACPACHLSRDDLESAAAFLEREENR